MTPHDPTARFESILRAASVIPVLTIRRIEDAVPLAHALVKGGLTVLEITLRSEIAPRAIRRIGDEVPGAIAGAGTILDAGDLADARNAGARFGVSPGLTPELAEAVAAGDMPFLPGVATASEIMRARSLGFRHLKFFPAEAMGGRAALNGFAGPFGDVLFCPTGGIREDTLASYLELPNVLCVGGSWLASDADIDKGEWSDITERARRVSQGRPSRH